MSGRGRCVLAPLKRREWEKGTMSTEEGGGSAAKEEGGLRGVRKVTPSLAQNLFL